MEIDQKLKQRLVGAAVITSLAAIFVPMLFDDPVDESRQAIRELSIPEPPVEVFDAEPVVPPKNREEVLALPEEDYEHVVIAPEPPSIVAEKRVEPQSEKRKTITKKHDENLVRWVIQVGSFGEQKNAIILRDKLRKQGFNAFVEINNNKLYRVRVGPELDRSRAEKTKARLEKINNVKSILVTE